MNTWKHSELSAYKFGGVAKDYFEIHKFIDSSKLFYFNVKHRSILHHTYGVKLCLKLFGDTITNSENETKLVRDIAIEHIKEDLNGRIPTLKEWFEKNLELTNPIEEIEKIEDKELKNFVMEPYLNSGIKSSFVITFSDFGVSLVNQIYGLEKAILLRNHLKENQNMKSILKKFKFSSRWQYSPDMNQLKLLNNK